MIARKTYPNSKRSVHALQSGEKEINTWLQKKKAITLKMKRIDNYEKCLNGNWHKAWTEQIIAKIIIKTFAVTIHIGCTFLAISIYL